MVTSIDVEEDFDKIQHSFLLKSPEENQNRKKLLRTISYI